MFPWLLNFKSQISARLIQQIFAGVEEIFGIEGAFDLGVEMTEGRRGGYFPPRFFGKTDAVLPADDAAHGENAPEQFVEDSVHMTIVWLRSNRSHQVDVNVAVPRMTKAGNRHTILLLQAGS